MARTIYILLITLGVVCPRTALLAQQSYGMFWEVSGNDLIEPIYLLGSIHVADERAFQFQDSVMIMLDAADIFATEVHPDTFYEYSYAKNRNSRMESDVQAALNSRMREIQYQEYLNNQGVPRTDMPAQRRPWYFSPIIRSRKYRGDYRYSVFLDAWLYGQAEDHGKKTISLEPVDLHLKEPEAKDEKILAGESQLAILRSMNQEYMDHLIEIYGKGDIETICEVKKQQFDRYSDILDERNEVMVDNLLEQGKKGRLFAVVGSAHLCGEKGMLDLLRKKSYRIRRVGGINTKAPDEYEWVSSRVDPNWNNYEARELGLNVKFPGPLDEVLIKYGTEKVLTSVDFGHGIEYIAFSRREESIREIKPKKLPDFIENRCRLLLENTVSKQTSTEWIDRNGIRVCHCKGKSDKRKERAEYDVFAVGNRFYVFGAAYHRSVEGDPRIEDYFKGYRVIEQKVKGAVVHVDERFSFQCGFPASAEHARNAMHMDEVGIVDIDLWIAKSPTTEDVFFTQVLTFPLGTYLEDDAAYFDGLNESIFKDKVGKPDFLQMGEMDGFPTMRYIRGREGPISSAGLIVLKGNRIYHHFCVFDGKYEGKKQAVGEEFISSFSFIRPQNSTLKKFESIDHRFEILSPGKVYIEGDTFQLASHAEETEFNSIVNYYFRDTNLVHNYAVVVFELQPFFKIESADSLWNWLNIRKSVTEQFDSIIADTIEYLSGQKGGRMLTAYGSLKHTHQNQYARFCMSGNRLYLLSAVIPGKDGNDKQALQFLKSFRLMDPIDTSWISGDKLTAILTQLQDSSLAVQENAKAAIGKYEVQDYHKKLLRDAVLKTYPGEDSGNYSIREYVLDAWRRVGDEETVSFLREHFFDLPKPARMRALGVLARRAEKQGFQLITELLDSIDVSEDEIYASYLLFRPLMDSLELVDHIYPEPLARLSKAAYRWDYLDAVIGAIDSGLIDPKQLSPYRSEFVQIIQEFRETPDTVDQDFWAYNNALILLCRLDFDDEIRGILNETIDDRHFSPKIYVIPYLLKNGIQVAPEKIEEIAEDDFFRRHFYLNMEAVGMESNFPRKYRRQEEMARSILWTFVSEKRDRIPDRARFLGRKLRTRGEDRGWFYLFEFVEEYIDGDEIVVAIIGVYDEEESNLTRTSLYSDYGTMKEGAKMSNENLFEYFFEIANETKDENE